MRNNYFYPASLANAVGVDLDGWYIPFIIDQVGSNNCWNVYGEMYVTSTNSTLINYSYWLTIPPGLQASTVFADYSYYLTDNSDLPYGGWPYGCLGGYLNGTTLYSYIGSDNLPAEDRYGNGFVLEDDIVLGDNLNISPSVPQNLSIAWYNNHPKLTWDTNTASDIATYKIWKYAEGSSKIVATITHNSNNSTHSWIDYDVEPAGRFDPVYTYSYKVKAVDFINNESSYSNQVSIDGTGGIWKKNDDETEEIVITEYGLNSNYPNPFNPTTSISYQIPKNSFVNLVVYNTLGQQVAELVNQHQSVGKYSVTFNANNLPSGVYIYKLHAGEFSSTKKMVLAK